MHLEFKRIHYLTAGVAFAIGLFTYFLTMQPTIPFWDCGEFSAAASHLQIPHPPGAPLWTLVGRVAMLLPTFADITARYNLISVLASALSILLLYLTLVRLIRIWRGVPKSNSDAIILFGGALIGALAYCWTDSFWFNALECEVYAFGSLFISLVPWLVLVWYDHADEPHNERYLLLIAYVIGLSLGVHQLALLTMFPVFMIVYMRRWNSVTEGQWTASIFLSILAIAATGFIILNSPSGIQLYEWILAGAGVLYYCYKAFAKNRGWHTMVVFSVLAFGVTFVVILSKLVEWAGEGLGIISILVLGLIFGAIIYSQLAKRPAFAMGGWMLAMVFLGYTTYMFVMVRATQNPPMNENAPSTFAKLAGYINRDQYGSMSLSDEFANRRLPQQKQDHPNTWGDAAASDGGPAYTSNFDFFWRYQNEHHVPPLSRMEFYWPHRRLQRRRSRFFENVGDSISLRSFWSVLAIQEGSQTRACLARRVCHHGLPRRLVSKPARPPTARTRLFLRRSFLYLRDVGWHWRRGNNGIN